MIREQQYIFREKLVNSLSEELMGPSDAVSTEILTEPPLTRYLIGMLYPISDETLVAEDNTGADKLGAEEEVGVVEETPIAMANLRYPSSAGITFAVDTLVATEIVVKVQASTYLPLEESKKDEKRWQRLPRSFEPVTVPISSPQKGKSLTLTQGLELYYRVREVDDEKIAAVTLVLLNKRRSAKGSLRDAESFFQVSLVVETPNVEVGAFVERRHTADISGDEDLDSYRLLYRKAVSFGVGHGCSVSWVLDPNDERRAVEVRTDFAPSCDLLLMDSNETTWGALDMDLLANGPKQAVCNALRTMTSAYLSWIAGQGSRVPKLSSDLRATADDHVRACAEAASRMEYGIATLENEPLAWEAFRLANQAMLDQRRRTVWLKKADGSVAPGNDKYHWRPFQVAFLLLCLRGVVDPKATTNNGDVERELVDLIWFPTGGGKTEAYLGLVAFTIFHRRLRDPGKGDGVTVLMRYTLRLLTIQQFERAALLIACCETLRKGRKDLGGEIAIGLWVGQGSTPNTREDAEEALKNLRRNRDVHDKNPMQLDTCIWCGTKLTAREYWVAEKVRPRLVISCSNKNCEFRQGLPVYVVDQDIYDHRPAMLIATADKFAAMPWNEKVSALFNLGQAQRPPELIIQDELHLISGPLGTLAGLYETAVDELCSFEREDGLKVRPKIVASTATIRRSKSQNKALFARHSRQFPPPGLDASDSFFAEERSRVKKASRLYLGLMAPASSHSTLMIRVYASLLQTLGEAAESRLPKAVFDPYWTLVGYFNSLRVLGGARMQVQDDVVGYMKVIAGRNHTRQRELGDEPVELTSRRPSTEMKPSLKKMSTSYGETGSPDVVIATNMISVGVDVDRLGLMVIMGQPQGTSEYIQASSRVGRQHPGLVITLFNSARTRDRSHYESFPTYHSALYRRVESSSVTPFSARARDRGLHAVLVALLRHTVKALAGNADAKNIGRQGDQVDRVRQLILGRMAIVEENESLEGALHLDEIISMWERLANEPKLTYRAGKDDNYLLADAKPGMQNSDQHLSTLHSLRDVDSTSDLYLER
jgi:Helicase conserved C-terminal domain